MDGRDQGLGENGWISDDDSVKSIQWVAIFGGDRCVGVMVLLVGCLGSKVAATMLLGYGCCTSSMPF